MSSFSFSTDDELVSCCLISQASVSYVKIAFPQQRSYPLPSRFSKLTAINFRSYLGFKKRIGERVWISFAFYLSKDGPYHVSYFQGLGAERFKITVLFPRFRMCLCVLMLMLLPYVYRRSGSVCVVLRTTFFMPADSILHNPYIHPQLLSLHGAGGEDVNQLQTNFQQQNCVSCGEQRVKQSNLIKE